MSGTKLTKAQLEVAAQAGTDDFRRLLDSIRLTEAERLTLYSLFRPLALQHAAGPFDGPSPGEHYEELLSQVRQCRLLGIEHNFIINVAIPAALSTTENF